MNSHKKREQARQLLRPAIRALCAMDAQCVYQTNDRADLNGTVYERWLLPSGVIVIAWADADGWDVFAPVHGGNNVDATLAALRNLGVKA